MTIAENQLIAQLPQRRPHAAAGPVRIGAAGARHRALRAREPARHVYFPIDCFISLVTAIEARPGSRSAWWGARGCWERGLVLGVGPCLCTRWCRAQAWPAHPGGAVSSRTGPQQGAEAILGRYLYVLMAQLATSSACTRFHAVGPRLARWLLMSQDRAHSGTFHLTHEFLAYMLGVRRVGITCAAGELQRRGVIDYHRGHISVLDRAGLEAAACGCYAADQVAYDRMFG